MPFVILLTYFWLLNFLMFSLYPGLVYCSGLCLNLCSVPVLIILSICLLHDNLKTTEWIVTKSDSIGSQAFVPGVLDDSNLGCDIIWFVG